MPFDLESYSTIYPVTDDHQIKRRSRVARVHPEPLSVVKLLSGAARSALIIRFAFKNSLHCDRWELTEAPALFLY